MTSPIRRHLAPDRRQVRTATLVCAALLGWLILATAASASLFLSLDRSSAAPGVRVTGRTAGEGAFPGPTDPLRTFLARASDADSVARSNDLRLAEVGRLVVDARGNGELMFVVPDLAPGHYVLIAYCPSCAATSFGRTMLPLADFEVIEPPPATDAEPLSTPPGPDGTAVGTVVVAAMVAIATFRRRQSRVAGTRS